MPISTKRRLKKRRLTSGKISSNILYLAIPATTSMLLQSAFHIVDAIWVGRIGSVAFAAVGAAGFFLWMSMSVANVIASGVLALVSRYIGGKEDEKALHIIYQSFFFGIIFFIVFSTLSIIFSDNIFGIMGLEDAVAKQGVPYLQIMMGGFFALLFFMIFDSIFRACGDTKTPLKILAISFTLNAILDPLLIFGIGPFEGLGVKGAAIASVVSRLVAVGLYFYVFFIRKMLIKVKRPSSLAIRWGDVWRIVRIGMPVSFSGIIFCWAYILLTRIAAPFGHEAVAGLAIGHRAESISFMSAVGFGVAASTLVGQNLGAGKPKRAAKSVWVTVLFLSAITATMMFIFLLVPETIVKIFNSDEKVVEWGGLYLRIVAVSQLFMGFHIIMEAAFAGAGDTLPPMFVSILVSVTRVPLAYYLAGTELGVKGIWWTISGTCIMGGILITILFLRGKWKEKKV